MKATPPYPSQRSLGFSLIELLVVISIIGIMVGLSFPVIGAMREGSRIEAATNTVSVAVDAARSLAVSSNDFGVGPISGSYAGTYDGTAVIFTPSGECRLVVNDERAVNGSGLFYELYDQDPMYPGYPNTRNAYKDIEGRDYIIMPSGSAVAGLRMGTTAQFVAPPFAVTFDEDGKAVARGSSGTVDGAVYYDGNANGAVTGTGRSGTYNPDDWDARLSSANAIRVGSGSTDDRYRYELPFEQIESCLAVAVYDQQKFEEAGLTWGSSTNAQIFAFMTDEDNAKVLFFSRATGVVIRN